MKAIDKTGWKRNLIEIFCILLAVLLAYHAENSAAWIFVVLMICLWGAKFLQKRFYVICFYVTIIVGIGASAIYFVCDSIPYVNTFDAGLKGKLANLTIPKTAGHNDMWISPLLEGKTVNLTYAAPWCWEYMEEFAEETKSQEREVPQFYTIIWGNVAEHEIRRVEGIDFVGTKDLYSEEEMEIMSTFSDEKTLFLDTEGLVDTKEVYVITDENYNIYLLSKEMVERILESNEAKNVDDTN